MLILLGGVGVGPRIECTEGRHDGCGSGFEASVESDCVDRIFVAIKQHTCTYLDCWSLIKFIFYLDNCHWEPTNDVRYETSASIYIISRIYITSIDKINLCFIIDIISKGPHDKVRWIRFEYQNSDNEQKLCRHLSILGK